MGRGRGAEAASADRLRLTTAAEAARAKSLRVAKSLPASARVLRGRLASRAGNPGARPRAFVL
ncbi:hypothetical protein [Alicyclobacillus vulcanalis]|uniref:hypothetical protein n=1 Tax=Alicyclobacillus vulcanalis TaxID=252246 RepID=UPI0011785C7C|nr:hypothetical protein [Alicyclobacillus vulcanalis]